MSEIDGRVEFGGVTRGMRKIVVRSRRRQAQEYLIPQGKHLHVHEGDQVRAGDRLTEGPINPHDILRVKGINEVQEYLVDEIQEVYRLQGVRIDDKHIEVIVRQMLQKVQVEDPGDTDFLEGEHGGQGSSCARRTSGCCGEGRYAGHLPAAAARDHQGVAVHRQLRLGGLLPGDHPGADRGGHPGQGRPLRGLKENVIIGHLIPAGTGHVRIP